jgi:rhamnosyltransferase
MRFSAGITLYNPTMEEISRILIYEKNFDKIYLYDNTEKTNANLNFFLNNEKFKYISSGQNNGLSIAFNILIQHAINDDFDFICLLDQDSVFPILSISNIKLYINNYHQDQNVLYIPKVIFSQKYINEFSNDNRVIEVNKGITSGTFFSLNKIKLIGFFDENYFIDKVDYDFCFRIRLLSFKIIQVNSSRLFQTIGSNKNFLFSALNGAKQQLKAGTSSRLRSPPIWSQGIFVPIASVRRYNRRHCYYGETNHAFTRQLYR